MTQRLSHIQRYPFGAGLAVHRWREGDWAEMADRTKYVTFSVVIRY